MPSQEFTENHLETILRGNHDSVFQKLEEFVDENRDVPQKCTKLVWDAFSDLLHKALEAPAESLPQITTVLRVFQNLAGFPEQEDELDALLDSGLASLMSECLITALHGVRDSEKEDINKLYEDILETITAVSDYSRKAKEMMIETFCDRLLQIVGHANFRPHIKIEAIKSVNSLMDGCTQESRDLLNNKISHRQQVQKIGTLLMNAGDYEFQAGIVESLFRLTNKTTRVEYVENWLPDESLRNCYLSIRDSSFEGDCRSFLNILNKRSRGNPRVISLPCDMAALGKYLLEKPEDGNYVEFWVDFNSGSERISLFCNQQSPDLQEDEEAMWETVSIWKNNVRSYIVIAGKLGVQNVQITLHSEVKDLITFGPDNLAGNTLTLRFDAKYDVMEALIMTLGLEKCARHSQQESSRQAALISSQLSVETYAENKNERKVSQAEHPVYVSSETGDIVMTNQAADENQTFKEPVAPAPNTRTVKTASQDSVSSTPVQRPPGDAHGTPRRKCSVPGEPMRTPTRTVVTEEEAQKSHVNSERNARKPEKAAVVMHSEIQGRNETMPKTQSQKALRSTQLNVPSTEEDSDTIPNSQTQLTRSKTRRKVSQSIPYIPQVADIPDVIPSSCPNENVIPDSQQSACVPEDSGARVPESELSEVSTNTKAKHQRKEEIAALKDKLSATDPNYTNYPANKYKLSNTPALSTVSEESPGYRQSLESKKDTPTHKTTNIAPIEEEDEEPAQSPTTSNIRKKAVNSVSPDSTCHPPEPAKKGRGKRAKKQDSRKATVSKTQETEEHVASSLESDTTVSQRATRSRKAKTGTAEKTAAETSEKNRALSLSPHGLDASDEEVPIPAPSQFIKQIVAEEKMKRQTTGANENLDKKAVHPSVQDEEMIDVIPASYEPEIMTTDKGNEKKKNAKGKKETSKPEEQKKKKRQTNKKKNSAVEDEDPYFFSDDEDQDCQEITVGKFYTKNGQKPVKNKKLPSPPKNNKNSASENTEKSKVLPPISKPSAKTIGKQPTKEKSTPCVEEEFPDLIVENDSFSQYRDYEYRFFKSRNSAEDSTISKTPKQNKSVNLSARVPKFFKSRAHNGKNDKGSLMFTSPLAGAPKIKSAKTNNNKQSTVSEISTTSNQDKKKQGRGKKTKAQAETVKELPEPEVHVTRLDSQESPIKSPVNISNIDVEKSPELRPLASELMKTEKIKAKGNTEAADEDKNNESSATNSHRQKMMEKIKQKMEEASGDREQLEKTLGKTDKSGTSHSKKRSGKRSLKEAEVEIEDSDDQNNNTSLEADHDADVSTNTVDESVDSFANLCQSLVRGAEKRPLRNKKNVTYTEMSESDIPEDQSMRRTNLDTTKDTKNKTQIEKKKKSKHRSVFSETDDGVSCRSEVSWLASTARKKKPKPDKIYEHSPKLRHPFIARDESSYHQDEETNETDNMDESYEPPPPPIKPLAAERKKKRKMPKSPQQTDQETSEGEDDERYYRTARPPRKRAVKHGGGDSDKENRPPASTLTEELPLEAEIPDLETPAAKKPGKSRQKSKQAELADTFQTGSQITRDVTSRLKQILQQTSGNVMSSEEKPAKNMSRMSRERGRRGSAVLDDAIERFRHDITTSGPLGDISPITVDEMSQKSVDGNDGLDVKSQMSYVSHISSLKTPKTPARRPNFAPDDDDDEDEVSPKSMKSGISLKSAKSAASTKSGKLLKRMTEMEENKQSGPSKRRKANKTEVVEEEEDDDEEDEVGSQGSQFLPRRLFTPEERLKHQQQQQLRKRQRHQSSGETSYGNVELDQVLSPATTSALQMNLDTRMLDFEDDDRLANGVSFMIKSFGGEIQKNMLARKQQLQVLSKGLVKNTQEDLSAFWADQTVQRERLLVDFQIAIESELGALEKDNKNLEDAEDKAMEFFVSQFKTIQGCLVSQKKRLGNLQKIQTAFSDDMVDLEHAQERQQGKMKDILRKNMKDLQKRLLLSTQQQEISSVKRTLQSLFM